LAPSSAILLPVVLGYTAFTDYVFRGKVCPARGTIDRWGQDARIWKAGVYERCPDRRDVPF
jgi:hypothetical protein